MEKVVSAGGIVMKGNKLIVVKFADGKITFPKGQVEEGESWEEAAVREVEEETGLAGVRIVKKLGVVTRPAKLPSGEMVMKDIHLYLMKVDDFVQGTGDEETEWLTVDEALTRFFPEEAEFLRKVWLELEDTGGI